MGSTRSKTQIERDIAGCIEELKRIASETSWAFPANSKEMQQLEREVDEINANLRKLRRELGGE